MFYHLIYYLILLRFTVVPPDVKEEITRVQTTLQESFIAGNYERVLILYDSLKQQSPLIPPAVSLTVAQAAHKLQDTTLSKPLYRQLAGLNLANISTVALNQLGVLAYQDRQFDTALVYFRKALDKNETYTKARYNYELVYKKYPPQDKQPAQANEETNKEQLAQQVNVTEQDNKKKDLLSQTVPPRMERERALQLLDAMRANELQGMSLRPMGNNSEKPKRNW